MNPLRRVIMGLFGLVVGAGMVPGPTSADGTGPMLLIVGASGAAESSDPRAESGGEVGDPGAAQSQTGSAAASAPIFVPRTRRGAPAARVGGASRSSGSQLTVLALVPRQDEAALTISPQPAFYWHLSAATPHAVNFTLIAPEAIDPILDVTLAGPFAAGVHVAELRDHGVQLEPGRRYEWFVAVMPEPEHRSADIIARGAVYRVAEPELEARLAAAAEEQRVALLAGAGIWYDALAALSSGPGDGPAPTRAGEQRRALLEQEGLTLGTGSE